MLQHDQSILVVVDFQDTVMPNGEADRGVLVSAAKRLIAGARILGVPILATEQNPEKLGTSISQIQDALGDAPCLSKMAFSAFGEPSVMEVIQATGRSQLVLTGVETHICVLQSALGALASGLSPYVVRDGVASLSPASHEAGLARMSAAGVVLPTVQMVLFEWLGRAGTPEFREALPLLKNP